ncbi:MAG: hypothetical protein COS09_01490 [Candidatus Nealsonbacteria bacterium CG01_land_8_20_14_3_00_12]|uniref:Phospholipid/glycerol acyltransferase domain-containing protein n=1 Tax=Candidatus Nealsonbacteria bacterium CG01_land_8_20_14_3_00_12 TaxID=1974697 RepID=A0A2M7EBG6_9BACT|nr:MAG: hypothetical protein COS09_01490 [Candidatus Nealsonbacteria bacterium CG01_land_8_20_14_3_00_12]
MIPKLIQQITYWPTYLILKTFFRYQAEARENLKGLEDRSVIFASNHASYIDGPISAAAMPRKGFTPKNFFPVRFLALKKYYHLKTNLFPFPLNLFTTLYARLNGSIPVVKGRGDLETALTEPIRALKEQKAVKLWIYPEGKITKHGKLQPGKRGAAYLHFKTGAPIVLVGIIGNYRMFAPANFIRFLLGFKKLKVRIGKPIYSLGNISLEEGTKKVMKAIENLIRIP